MKLMHAFARTFVLTIFLSGVGATAHANGPSAVGTNSALVGNTTESRGRNLASTAPTTAQAFVYDGSQRAAGTTSASAPVDVASFATGGAGTEASPWTGWETAITWSNNTLYYFRKGHFAAATFPNWGNLYHTAFVGDQQGATVLKHTGAGKAVNFTTTPAGITKHTQGILFENFLIVGNGASTTFGLYCEAVHRSIFRNVRILDVGGTAAIAWVHGILNVIENVGMAQNWNANGGAIGTIFPKYILGTGIRAPGETFQDNQLINFLAENATVAAILLDGALQNTFVGGTAENNNGKGIVIGSTSHNNTFTGMDVEGNTGVDWEVFGNGNTFVSVLSTGDFRIKPGAKSNVIISGRLDDLIIEAGAVSTTLVGVGYGQLRGAFSDSGTNTQRVGRLYNMGTGAHTGMPMTQELDGVGINTTAPSSYLHVNGSFAMAIKGFRASEVIGAATGIILATATITITLPPAASALGRIYPYCNVGVGVLTIDGNEAELINGVPALAVAAGKSGFLVSNGAGWHTIGNN